MHSPDWTDALVEHQMCHCRKMVLKEVIGMFENAAYLSGDNGFAEMIHAANMVKDLLEKRNDC